MDFKATATTKYEVAMARHGAIDMKTPIKLSADNCPENLYMVGKNIHFFNNTTKSSKRTRSSSADSILQPSLRSAEPPTIETCSSLVSTQASSNHGSDTQSASGQSTPSRNWYDMSQDEESDLDLDGDGETEKDHNPITKETHTFYRLESLLGQSGGASNKAHVKQALFTEAPFCYMGLQFPEYVQDVVVVPLQHHDRFRRCIEKLGSILPAGVELKQRNEVTFRLKTSKTFNPESEEDWLSEAPFRDWGLQRHKFKIDVPLEHANEFFWRAIQSKDSILRQQGITGAHRSDMSAKFV